MSISADESQAETSATITRAFFSSEQISSRSTDRGEPPNARMERESVLYGRENRPRSEPESELEHELTREPQLELAREYISRS